MKGDFLFIWVKFSSCELSTSFGYHWLLVILLLSLFEMVPNLDFSERIFISLILDMNIVQASSLSKKKKIVYKFHSLRLEFVCSLLFSMLKQGNGKVGRQYFRIWSFEEQSICHSFDCILEFWGMHRVPLLCFSWHSVCEIYLITSK